MGLDSVELIIEWERYFNIEIPNPVTEKIRTVQNAVDAISSLLNISNNSTELKDHIFSKLQKAISRFVSTNETVIQSDLVSKLFPEYDKEIWAKIARELKLEIPDPPDRHDSIFKTKVLSIYNWVPYFDYSKLKFDDLTDIICGNNCNSLIEAKTIKSKCEIYIALMAITVDKIGIDFYEFKPDKSFTGDFGIE